MLNMSNILGYQQKQTMPIPSVWFENLQKNPLSPEEIKEAFLKDVRKYCSENIHIPSKSKNSLRIMTFNVRMWTNIYDQPNFNQIVKNIKELNPDLLILQEVTDWEKTSTYFNQLGYDQIGISCITKNPSFGSAILAKNCLVKNHFSSIFSNQSDSSRELSFVRLDLEVNNKNISVYGTHLEVDDLKNKKSLEIIREKQLEEIFKNIRTLNHSNIIIAGDFNSIREQDYDFKINNFMAWNLLKMRYEYILKATFNPSTLSLFSKYGFASSFELLGWNGPKFTSWIGAVLDFIFFNANNFSLEGSYVYYTDSSDHLPVIADILI